MNADFVNLTTENLNDEHLCCIIRSKKPHAGIDAKRRWLSDRLSITILPDELAIVPAKS